MTLFNHPSDMDPLIPGKRRDILAELTKNILQESGSISSMPLNDIIFKKVKGLLRLVNCYYSNSIEGQPTTPAEVEKARLGKLNAEDNEQRNLQLLGKSHVELQEKIEDRLNLDSETNVYSKDWMCYLHEEFYNKLPQSCHKVKNEKGECFDLPIGKFRDYEVTIKNHTPPTYSSIDTFINRYDAFYNDINFATSKLISIASSHQRFEWIHPFGDGNGRVGRLLTHSALIKENLHGYGLWSLDRGLARNRDRYYKFLGLADQKRVNDYDGRGPRSDLHLQKFCEFFLQTMLDQITFMKDRLQFSQLLPRIEISIRDRFPNENTINDKEEAQIKLICRHLLIEGSLSKGELTEKIGVSKNIGTKIIKKSIDLNIIEVSPHNRHHVELKINTELASKYFPDMGFS